MSTHRRGFDHWLGQKQDLMPKHLTPERLLRYYWYLRHSSVKKNRQIAAHKIILTHIRLGMSVVSGYAVRWPSKTDLLVSEMLWMLVHATDLMELGSIDHHAGEPNITGYLTAMVNGHLRKVGARDRLLSVDPTRFRKGKHGVAVALNGHDFEFTKGDQKAKETLEVVNSTLRNDMEREIISLRIKGFDDTEIGQKLGITKQRVWTLRNDIREKVMEKLQ